MGDLNGRLRAFIDDVGDASGEVRDLDVEVRNLKRGVGDLDAGPGDITQGIGGLRGRPNETGRPEAACCLTSWHATQAGSASFAALWRCLAKRPPSSRRSSSRPCAPPDSLICA